MGNLGHTPNQIVIITASGPSSDALTDSADAPIAIPEPPVRPDRLAQWDEVHGCWIVWDETTESWIAESQPMVIDLRDPVPEVSTVLARS